jgi:hypothetical protein
LTVDNAASLERLGQSVQLSDGITHFMAYIRVTIVVRGLTEAQVDAGLADLLDEFEQRDWLVNPGADWDYEREGLVVTIDYEGRDTQLCGKAVLDEVQDCLAASLQFTSDLRFEIEDSSHAPSG